MTTPSSFGATGLSVGLFQPLILGGAWINDYTEEITAYGQEKAADMYYVSASVTLSLHSIDLLDWLLYGLGRHIITRAPSQRVVWVGFVNYMTIATGQKTYEVGPLMDIGNRVYVTYTPVYVSAATGTIVKGTSTESPLVNDTTSQARFGIIEKNLAAGECIITDTQNEANRFRDEFLIENAYPKINSSFSFGAGEAAVVTLECVGYWKWLDAYAYNNRATAAADGWSVLSTKLQAILTANPNLNIRNIDFSRIMASTAIGQNREKDNKTALTIIKGICAAGDPAGNRWLFGVGLGRQAYYNVIPTTINYEYRVNDNQQKLVVYGTDAAVDPWDIEPGRWYISSDIYKPINYASNYSIPTASFIESVRFTAPYSFDLTEGKMSKISQMLNYRGLGAI